MFFLILSSGIYGVPKELCAKMYLKAALDFSQNYPHTNIKELHIVDVKDDILFMIAGAHAECLENPRSLSPSVAVTGFDQGSKIKHHHKQQQIATHKEHTPKKLNRTSGAMFGEKPNIKIYTCDLLKVKGVEAIVSSQDPGLSSNGKLSGAIYRAMEMKLKPKKKYPFGSVIVSSAGKLIPDGRILHAVVRQVSDPPRDSEVDDIANIVSHILCICEKLKIHRIAMPFLGTGKIVKIIFKLTWCC